MLIGGLSVGYVALLLTLGIMFFRGRLHPAATWALSLLIAVATSKVFSTQYLLWVLPFVALAHGENEGTVPASHREVMRVVWVLISVLTSVIFPIGYTLFPLAQGALGEPAWLMVVITLRNSLWLVAIALALADWTMRSAKRRPINP